MSLRIGRLLKKFMIQIFEKDNLVRGFPGKGQKYKMVFKIFGFLQKKSPKNKMMLRNANLTEKIKDKN